MSSFFLSLIFDLLLASLLVATISYCWKLNHRIRLLQDSKSELAEMIAKFDGATTRASKSLSELQQVSKRITEVLQLKIDKANFLADDLAFLIDKSGKAITQIEQAKKAAPAEKPKAMFESKPFFAAVKPTSAKPSPAQPASNNPALGISSLESVLQKLATAAGANPRTTANAYNKVAASNNSPAAPRTEAERELIEALKSGR